MKNTKNILVVGVGGQGILLTSKLIGQVSINAGYDVKLSEVHGMAQRGGSVVTFAKYGEKVYSPLVEEGTADVILAFEKMEALRYIEYLKPEGCMIINDQEIDPMPVIMGVANYPDDVITKIKSVCKNTYVVDAIDEAKELGNPKVANTILLGILAQQLDFSDEEWYEAIKVIVPQKTIEVNIKAFDYGKNL